MKVEGPKFRFWLSPNATAEERGQAAHAVCLHCVDPPRSQAELRAVAVRTAMSLYEGTRSGRAKMLADRYRAYLTSGWKRERDMKSLPYPRTTERVCLHRLARVNRGHSLGWRQLFDIASSPQD